MSILKSLSNAWDTAQTKVNQFLILQMTPEDQREPINNFFKDKRSDASLRTYFAMQTAASDREHQGNTGKIVANSLTISGGMVTVAAPVVGISTLLIGTGIRAMEHLCDASLAAKNKHLQFEAHLFNKRHP